LSLALPAGDERIAGGGQGDAAQPQRFEVAQRRFASTGFEQGLPPPTVRGEIGRWRDIEQVIAPATGGGKLPQPSGPQVVGQRRIGLGFQEVANF